MSDIIFVTNRYLCKEDFLTRMEKLAAVHPAGIILREKDLDESQYKTLARDVSEICKRHGTPCILHNFPKVADELNCDSLHLPLEILRGLDEEKRKKYKNLGTSCHSLSEAQEAQVLGCTYIIAGHIFDTNCKKGMPGRGIGFLKEICRNSAIPVYAIGGIGTANICEIRSSGAKGACVMSGAMTCKNVREYICGFEEIQK